MRPLLKTQLTFLLPSLAGLILFMMPVYFEQEFSIPVAILAKTLQAGLGEAASAILVAICLVTALLSSLARFSDPGFIRRSPFLTGLFKVSISWYLIRLMGMALILVTMFKIGPAALWSSSTGGLILYELLPTLLCVFIFAGLLLPLLLNFGLLEFVGTLLSRVMRPIFRLPGRCAIDSMASWLGDGSVGVMLTSQQYEDKFYTQREAAVIATSFSAVSISFSLVVLAQVNLEHLFAQFYLTVCVAGLFAAIVVPRLPPLCWFEDRFIDQSRASYDKEKLPEGHHLFSWGLHLALQRAERVAPIKQQLRHGLKNVIDMVFGVIPVIMAVGTLALVVAETTPVFDMLGKPFVPLLELLQLPEAQAASKTLVVGFADMFIPSILATSIESDLTRFVIACLSVTQLIYMSEVGALILGSHLPIKLWHLFVIFILRTLVTLPIIALMAHLFF